MFVEWVLVFGIYSTDGNKLSFKDSVLKPIKTVAMESACDPVPGGIYRPNEIFREIHRPKEALPGDRVVAACVEKYSLSPDSPKKVFIRPEGIVYYYPADFVKKEQ